MSTRIRRRKRNSPIPEFAVPKDIYGFTTKYDRTVDYTPKIKNYKITNKMLKNWLKYICAIILLSLIFIASNHAWNEYPDDILIIKMFRTWLAILFAPIYVFYIFVKKTVFKPIN